MNNALAIIVLTTIVLVCLFAPIITPLNPMATDAIHQLQSPDRSHILGTDLLGRDVFSRLLYGGQRSLLIAFLASGLAIGLGTTMGIVAGISSVWIDHLLAILMNALLAFPNLLFALMILTLMGGRGEGLILATGFSQIVPFARVTRSVVLSVQSMGYVEAAYASGASNLYVTLHSTLPNIYPTLLTYAGVTFSYCLLNSAALSFLGLGGQPGIPDWGVMLAEGRMTFRDAPWTALAPGLAVTIIIWTINGLTGYKMGVRQAK